MADTAAITPDNSARVIMLTFGNMDQGGMYWAYVAVKPSRFDYFKQALTQKYNIQNFVKDEFGEIVVSGEGGLPPKHITKQVAQLFGIPIDQLFASTDPLPIVNQAVELLKKNNGTI